jgi:plastocyanin
VGSRSFLLIIALSFGVLFSLVYVSNYVLPKSVQYYHDPSEVPAEPRVTQLQALEVAARALKEQHGADEEVMLWFTQYNYTEADFEAHPEKYTVGYQWPLSTIRQNPELLKLQLVFFHQNGTIYHIDGSDISKCDCGTASDLRRNYLAWRIDAIPDVVDVDAETGKLLWPRLVTSRFPVQVAIYENVSEAKTVKEELQARLNPPQTTKIEILEGSGSNDAGISYKPERATGTIEVSNRVVWTNGEAVAHTVRYDDRYPVRLNEQFNSGSIPPEGTYEHTFDRVGEYPYHCDIHPWMKGTVSSDKQRRRKQREHVNK